jgi:transcriptional regulator with GAF, ATPase, and Fis domain
MKLNKLPLTLFPNLLEDLANSDVIYTNKASVFEKKYPVLGAILSSKKVNEFIIMPLTGISNPIGFILIEKINHEGFTKDDRVYLNRLIQKITMLLDYKKSDIYGKC